MRQNANFFSEFSILPTRIMNIISRNLSNIQNILFTPFFLKNQNWVISRANLIQLQALSPSLAKDLTPRCGNVQRVSPPREIDRLDSFHHRNVRNVGDLPAVHFSCLCVYSPCTINTMMTELALDRDRQVGQVR